MWKAESRSSSSVKQQREEGHGKDDRQVSATWYQPNRQAYLNSPVTYISIEGRRCLYPNRTPSTSSFTTRKQTKESALWLSVWPAYTPTGSAIKWKSWIVRQIRKCNYTTLSWTPRKENGIRPADAWSPPGKYRLCLPGFSIWFVSFCWQRAQEKDILLWSDFSVFLFYLASHILINIIIHVKQWGEWGERGERNSFSCRLDLI